MKRLLLITLIIAAFSLQTHAQGVVYDQESDTSSINPIGNEDADGLNIQTAPLTQSFIPMLSAIDFVTLEFEDVPDSGTTGMTIGVNLYTSSPTPQPRNLIGSTTPVYMPNGFVNDGLFVAGVTNFYFSTPVVLTPGQTYYLEPVVLSGGDALDITSLTYDAYSDGQLFGEGSPANHTIDLWFQEGIVAAPEPTTLALVGLSGLLMFAFKRRSKLVVLLLFAAPLLPVYSAPDSVIQATAEAAGLTPASALPGAGTFWVMAIGSNGQITEWPYPSLPATLSALPIYALTNNIFIVDDTGGEISPLSTERMSSTQAASTVQTQAQTVENLIELIQNLSTNDEIGETTKHFDSDFSCNIFKRGVKPFRKSLTLTIL
jgi:hypothetical protein